MKMTGNKGPVFDWEAEYDCPECGEVFYFMREDGWSEMQGWTLQVYHDHTEDPEGVWRAAAYRKWKGRRRPTIEKDVKEQHSKAYKAGAEQRRIANASVD